VTAAGTASSSCRAFVALELDDALHERLAALAAELRPSFPGLRFVRAQGIHLTLRFLGQSSPAQLERLGAMLAEAAAAYPATTAPVAGLGVFPARGSPRVLWLGIDVADPVLDLQAACERAAVRAGFEPEHRRFRAHLTLGRWRDRASSPALPAVDLGPTRLSTLTLFRSDLGPGGSLYTALGRWSLGGGAAA
jgi:2'-5' RNA ligase